MTASLCEDLVHAVNSKKVDGIRALLCQGADVTHNFNICVQSAAMNGFDDGLCLLLAADPDFHAAKNDAMRSALRTGESKTFEMVRDSISFDSPLNREREILLAAFREAVDGKDIATAEKTLDQLVAKSFPKLNL